MSAGPCTLQQADSSASFLCSASTLTEPCTLSYVDYLSDSLSAKRKKKKKEEKKKKNFLSLGSTIFRAQTA